MHEMTIAVGLVDLAEETPERRRRAHQQPAGRVGALAGIETSSLSFCWESARRGTLCETAALDIVEIPGRGRCPACGEESVMDFFVAVCPLCRESGLEVLQGRELKLRSLNID